LDKVQSINGKSIITDILQVDAEFLKNIVLSLKEQHEDVTVALGSVFEEKPYLCLYIPESRVQAESLDAGFIIREAAREIQGGGGGQ